MSIERIGAQVVCRFTPDEAELLADETERRYDDEILNGAPTNYDLCDFLWDIKSDLRKSAQE